MKTDRELVFESIDHWKRMIERCKWLVGSGYDCSIHNWKLYMDESFYSEDCSLCQRYLKADSKYNTCDIDTFCSPWWRTVNLSFELSIFIERAEKYMIPALYECLNFCKDKKE